MHFLTDLNWGNAYDAREMYIHNKVLEIFQTWNCKTNNLVLEIYFLLVMSPDPLGFEFQKL